MPNFPGFSKSLKQISHTVEENIHRRRTAIRATNSKKQERRERESEREKQ
jgi:hypothetical protein